MLVKLLDLAIAAGLATMFVAVSAMFPIEQTPLWVAGIQAYIVPAFVALGNIPVLDTLVAIIHWWLVFEIMYFTLKTLLRLGEWLRLTGASFIP